MKKKIIICGDFQAAKIFGLLDKNIKIIGITGNEWKNHSYKNGLQNYEKFL